jgi:hypothetical protein
MSAQAGLLFQPTTPALSAATISKMPLGFVAIGAAAPSRAGIPARGKPQPDIARRAISDGLALRGAGLDDTFNPLQQLHVARNDREEIIEVVSDTIGRHLALGVLTPSTQGFVKYPFQGRRVVRFFQHQTRSSRFAISGDENDGSAAGSYRFRHGVHALATEIDVEKGHIEVRGSCYLQSVIEFVSRTSDHAAQIQEHSLQVER